MKSQRQFAAGLLLLALFGCGGTGANPEDQPLTGSDPALNGTWLCTRMEEGGKPLSADGVKKVRLTYLFENGTLTVKNAKNETLTRTYAVDPTATPKRYSVDVNGVKSKDIYEINGKELRICMSVDGKKYPTEFVSRPNSTDLMVFVRQ
jgi:uncharacterized protein (TIGR03067 family)